MLFLCVFAAEVEASGAGKGHGDCSVQVGDGHHSADSARTAT